MANVKISQLTAKAAKVESTDRIPIADYNGTTYDTKYVTGAEINELKLDTSPQLGGNLDVNGHTITSDSDQDVIINPNGTGITKIESNLVLRDSAGATAKEVLFYEGFSNGTNYVGLKAANSLSTNTTYTLPTADGTNGQVLQTNGSGTLSWFGAKKYVALLTQTGTSAPTATVLENTLGGTLVWSYDGVGSYIGTLTGAFTSNKTAVLISGVYKGSVSGLRKTDNTVQITTTATSTNTEANALLDSTTIEIKVYP
jgi:hypothetical protein